MQFSKWLLNSSTVDADDSALICWCVTVSKKLVVIWRRINLTRTNRQTWLWRNQKARICLR